MAPYILLYNLFGYPSHGEKRALLRYTGTGNPDVIPCRWDLIDVSGKTVLTGTPVREPDTFRMVVWSCDFSAVAWPELYTLRTVFSDGSETVSERFEIARSPYLNALLIRLSIHNAAARYARGTVSGGYYDCNSRMGEAYSHGVFLRGLCRFEKTEGDYLLPSERTELRQAQQIAFDYLMRLYVPETGEFVNCAPDRPYDPHNFGSHNTFEALTGICEYLLTADDPVRVTEENRSRVEKSLAYILKIGADSRNMRSYPYEEWRLCACCLVYRVTGKRGYLEQAKEQLLGILDEISIYSLPGGWHSAPLFEAAWELLRFCPEIAGLQKWRDCLDRAERDIRKLTEENAFYLLPADGNKPPLLVNGVLLWGINACYLAMLTGKDIFLKAAGAALDFPCGLNYGLPAEMTASVTGNRLVAASFFANTGNGVRPWKKWYFHMGPEVWASTINGYTDRNGEPFYTDETWQSGETFIKTDGQFLCLAGLYEELMRRRE